MTRLLSLTATWLTVFLFFVGCATAQPSTAPTDTAESSATAVTPRVYVCNQGSATVTVLDAATHDVIDTIDLQELGFSANAKPHHAVAEPDGSFWYLSLIAENTVLKFNSENEIVGQADMDVPGMMAIQPEGELLFVGRSMSAVNPPKSLGVINRADMSLEMIDTFFPRPHALTTSPDGKRAYVASLATNQLLSLDADTRDISLTRLGGDNQTLVQFASTPDGSTLIGGGQVTGQLLFFDASDPANITVTDTLDVGNMPWHPVISPDGKTAYVPIKGDNAVAVIDIEERAEIARITGNGLAQPHGSALSADGTYLFVTNNNQNESYAPEGDDKQSGTVVVIDTETREIVKVVETGRNPTGIGTFGGQNATQTLAP
ncbi:YncE family protein [Longibacter salinarum]|uniref:YncE family protein n=1 Tax=Longibacter salinarum TaxID=1850348 RepID=UPI00117E051A|nr:YncE family protein [Longibacter salinarum]